MNNFISTVGKWYCINLDSRPDRWSMAQLEFEKLGIQNKIERISAISDAAISNPKMNRGEHGLIETNIEIIKSAQLTEHLCIFEDDVTFLPEKTPVDALNAAGAQLPSDWGLLYLGAHLFDRKVKHPLVSENLVRLLPEPKPSKKKDHVFVGGAHAIIFSQGVRDFILNLNEKILFEAQWDVFLSKYIIPQFPCFLVYPSFAFQREDYSDLEGAVSKRNWIIEHNEGRIFPLASFEKTVSRGFFATLRHSINKRLKSLIAK